MGALLVGKLLGGVDKPAFVPRLLDIVCLRELVMVKELSPISLAAAATAATFVETLFLRVTRFVGLREPDDMEWEWLRL